MGGGISNSQIITEEGKHALDAVQNNPDVEGSLRQSININKETILNLLNLIIPVNFNNQSVVRCTDLNNPPNVFLLPTSINPTGYPTGLGGNSCMVVQYIKTNYDVQLAFSFGSDKIAIRRKPGQSTWTEWKYLSFS